MSGRNTGAVSITEDYVRRFPLTASRTLAAKMLKEHPEAYASMEAARTSVRYVRGALGAMRRQYRPGNQELWALDASGVVPSEPTLEVFVDLPHATRWLVLADAQIPFMDADTFRLALKTGKEAGVDGVLLMGDWADCYQLSDFCRSPAIGQWKAERFAVCESLEAIREEFPKAQIVYKLGNHEDRLLHYLQRRAPEIYDEEILNFETWVPLRDYGATLVDSWAGARMGKLTWFHGHEFGRGTFGDPVNAARWLYLRTKSICACAHYHSTAQHTEPTVHGVVLTCWSIGCMCDLHPRYRPHNKWNLGFSTVSVDDSEGNFSMTNYRVLPGGRLVT